MELAESSPLEWLLIRGMMRMKMMARMDKSKWASEEYRPLLRGLFQQSSWSPACCGIRLPRVLAPLVLSLNENSMRLRMMPEPGVISALRPRSAEEKALSPRPHKPLLQGCSAWSCMCPLLLTLAGALGNSFLHLPHGVLKKIKEMPTEKPCEQGTKGSIKPRVILVFVAMATTA
ncbi:hypothetical protein P7K49_000985 [Saguinus oedipus]|uniref:Uncharacterized protein n=1 Tax=Saguinus oedipus TaxID=9490 RepID=A0ABQ9WDA7_SAGOE|nr:hypothetical protein P7K49_000985 [Saguinus oedipus]